MTLKPLLDVQNLRVAFAGKGVVHGISFCIQPGEKLALVGESGSGKSVTALALLRLVQGASISGSAQFVNENGLQGTPAVRELLSLSEHALRGIRGDEVAFIFQEPMTALNPLMTVGQQIAEVLQLKQGKSRAESAQGAIDLLASTGIPEPARRAGAYPHQLSGGQRQRAMIAMALACKPKLLLADEPTTALDVTLRQQILDLLADLQRQHGMAVLLITHDLNLVRRFADRVAVMENGHLVEQGTVAEVFSAPQHAYTRRLLASKPVRDVVELPLAEPGAPAAAPSLVQNLVQTQALRVAYPVPVPGLKGWFKKAEFVAVQGASFTLRAGQTLGVIGESGSGKSTLAQAVLGLLPFSGQLAITSIAPTASLENAPVLEVKQPKTPANTAYAAPKNIASGQFPQTLRRQVQVVFQDPFSSLSPRMTVEEIVGEGLRVHAPQLNAAQRQAQVLRALNDVGLGAKAFPGLLQRYPHAFSGGQRQRIAIARALIVGPQLLVLDEPTSALDVTIQQQVLQLLQRLQRERGLAYLLITHDVDVIRAMAHEVLVMQGGQVLEAGRVDQVLNAPQHAYTRALVADAGLLGPTA